MNLYLNKIIQDSQVIFQKKNISKHALCMKNKRTMDVHFQTSIILWMERFQILKLTIHIKIVPFLNIDLAMYGVSQCCTVAGCLKGKI